MSGHDPVEGEAAAFRAHVLAKLRREAEQFRRWQARGSNLAGWFALSCHVQARSLGGWA